MSKIFIIEDDLKLRKELSLFLSSYGYECILSDDFHHITDKAIQSNSDLILLDINLPYFDGFHICREIRKISSVPIIIVTSRNSDMDELMSMNLGADDFITKPYNTQILLARIGAILKRSNILNKENTIIKYKEVALNLANSTLSFKDSIVELTKNELKILSVLMQNQGTIVSRNDIINELWQSDEFVDDNTLTVNITRIRKKLEDIGLFEFLVTKRGQGYIV